MRTLALSIGVLLIGCSDGGSRPSVLGGPSPDAATTMGDAAVKSDAAIASDASATEDATANADGGTPTSGVCDPTRTFSTATALVTTNGTEALPAIGADGLALAWITPSDDVIHYAARPDLGSAFSGAKTLAPTGLATGERVALAHDALKLYALRSDRRAIVVFHRDSIDDAFTLDASDASAANLEAELAVGETFSDLVIGASGLTLIYRRVGGASPGIRLAQRVLPGDPWSSTEPFANQSELAVTGGKARRPTGLAADRRTLFFDDEVTGHARAAFFAWDATTSSSFVDLGARSGIQPTADCTTVYYAANGDLARGDGK